MLATPKSYATPQPYVPPTYRLTHRPSPKKKVSRRQWLTTVVYPEPGFMTFLCWSLGVLDLGLLTFIVLQLSHFHH